MTERKTKVKPSWNDIKSQLARFDRAGLLKLIHDLYAASKDNQAFLHARFALGSDVLGPYKQTIERWLWPDILRNQNSSVANAKKAISDYKKAVGQPEGLAELTVFFCEQAAGFSRDVGIDEPYALALMRMFEEALKVVVALPAGQQRLFMARLHEVRRISNFGYGVAEEMDYLLAEYEPEA